jgi:hypothetical protein
MRRFAWWGQSGYCRTSRLLAILVFMQQLGSYKRRLHLKTISLLTVKEFTKILEFWFRNTRGPCPRKVLLFVSPACFAEVKQVRCCASCWSNFNFTSNTLNPCGRTGRTKKKNRTHKNIRPVERSYFGKRALTDATLISGRNPFRHVHSFQTMWMSVRR